MNNHPWDSEGSRDAGRERIQKNSVREEDRQMADDKAG